MPTLANLKAKIASDLHRSDLTTQIADAITNSIRRYNRDRFWFLEATATITLAASTPSYNLPSDFKAADTVLFNDTSGKYPVGQVSYIDLDTYDSGISNGNKPSVFAIYGDKIRFYPVPDGTYSVIMSYQKALDAPSDSGSNAWTSAGYDLIRYGSEKELYAAQLRNKEMAAVSSELERESFDSLRKEHVTRVSTGSIRRSGF